MKAESKFISCSIPTKLGAFVATFSEKGLCRLSFPEQQSKKTNATLDLNTAVWRKETEKALNETLSGKKISKFPKLDISRGTEFQQQVWKALKNITTGKSLTYGEIAQKIKREKAVRAVGSACGANPIPVLIPCHRVLAANKRLGGFSGGIDWKKRLLKIEGIEYAL